MAGSCKSANANRLLRNIEATRSRAWNAEAAGGISGGVKRPGVGVPNAGATFDLARWNG